MYFIRKVKIPICINEKVTNLDLVVRKCHIFGIKLTESNITEFSKISKKYVHPDLQYIFGQHYMLRMQILFNFSIFNFFVQYYRTARIFVFYLWIFRCLALLLALVARVTSSNTDTACLQELALLTSSNTVTACLQELTLLTSSNTDTNMYI